MNFLNKLEKKIGKRTVPGLTKYMIATYIIGYVIQLVAPNVVSLLALDPALIFKGQIWRLVTWLLIPGYSLSIFTIIMLWFYYSIGTTLEQTWGDFRYNLYVFGGIITTVFGAFLLYVYVYLTNGQTGAVLISGLYSQMFTTYYICMSIFLGFAMTYPDMKVLFFFLIPIKIKWLALLDLGWLAYVLVVGNLPIRVLVICSLLNVLVFFLLTRDYKKISPKEIHRKQAYYSAVKVKRGTAAPQRGGGGITKHKCAICGRTEEDSPELEFRFCSKCNGNYEYCNDHLFTHEHKV
ncbi:hypothetical protein FACS1894111_03770 [Clostridia bacterium]|nr:hypothetical protein FACS1894111_03770 [Clostridia bacterium]